jgi:hypothetical protein
VFIALFKIFQYQRQVNYLSTVISVLQNATQPSKGTGYEVTHTFISATRGTEMRKITIQGKHETLPEK